MGELADLFRSMHVAEAPLVMPNAWDRGSVRLLDWAGFSAIATTSWGFASTLGRADGRVTRSEALGHVADLAASTSLPVSADLEDCFADDPDGVAATIREAAELGAAGASVEDWSRSVIHPIELAAERVAAAAEAARPSGLVLTARAENLIRGVDDLEDTIARLQTYQEAGADVVYAPGLATVEAVRAVVSSVDLPVSVLLVPGGPTVTELAEAGAARVSVGHLFSAVSWGAVLEAASQLRDSGVVGQVDLAGAGGSAAGEAFRERLDGES